MYAHVLIYKISTTNIIKFSIYRCYNFVLFLFFWRGGGYHFLCQSGLSLNPDDPSLRLKYLSVYHLCMYMCVCVCVYIYIYICMYVYMKCIHICVCVYDLGNIRHCMASILVSGEIVWVLVCGYQCSRGS